MSGLTDAVNRIVKNIGEAEITDIEVARVPISSATKLLLNIVSLGNFQKRFNELPYDKLYHIYLILSTEHGKFVLEKNELINMKRFSSFAKDTDRITIKTIPKGLNLNTLLSKTRARLGGNYNKYSAYDNNCQTFVNAILSSNGLNTPEIKKFVLQDTKHLFENDSRFRKIVNTITDIGGVKKTIEPAVIDTVKSRVLPFSELLHPKYDKYNLLDKIKKKIANPFQTLKF